MWKHLTIKYYCQGCLKKQKEDDNYGVPLLKHPLIVSVNGDFNIRELREDVLNNKRQITCKKHPESKIVLTYSFYHEEKLNNECIPKKA